VTFLLLIFLLVPVAIFCGVGFRERRNARTFATFLQHGDRISNFHFFATLTSSTAGLASTLLLIAVYGYLYGLGVCVWIVLFWWLTQWASLKTILRVERLRPGFWKRRGTFHEFLGEMYGSTAVRSTAAVLSVICYTLLLVAEVILSYRLVFAATEGGTGTITSFPISALPLTVHGAILFAVFSYTALAGFRAVIRTDAISLNFNFSGAKHDTV
jgi:Na+(H+)/acetate symporter ActP